MWHTPMTIGSTPGFVTAADAYPRRPPARPAPADPAIGPRLATAMRPGHGPRRRGLAVVSVAGALALVVVGGLVSYHANHDAWVTHVPMRAMSVTAIVTGCCLWFAHRFWRLGPLLVAWGAAVSVGDLRPSSLGAVWTLAFLLTYLHTGVSAHIALALPDGRLYGPVDRVVVACAYTLCVGTQVSRYMFDRPPPGRGWSSQTLSAATGSVTSILLAAAVICLLTQRWLAASAPLRRMVALPWLACILWGMIGIALAVSALAAAPDHVQLVLFIALLVIWLAALVTVHWWHVMRVRLVRWRLVSIALELERGHTARGPAQLQEALATALGDPQLRLAYRLDDGRLDDGRYVDVDGAPTSGRPQTPNQIATPVRRDDRPIAVIVHDCSLELVPGLVEVAAAAAGIAIEKAHLHAVTRAQIAELRTSRERMVTVAMTERERIQRDLHDGAQQRLFSTAVLLDIARHRLEQSAQDAMTEATDAVGMAQHQLADAIRSLRQLTRGIYPRPLTEQGLAAAVEALCHGSPIPVERAVDPSRWPPPIEFAAYFVVAEALTNVYRHAGATRAVVSVRATGGRVHVVVGDDGRGGADTGPGTGLRGLRDRVASVGGSLRVVSPPGAGTRIYADLPAGDAR